VAQVSRRLGTASLTQRPAECNEAEKEWTADARNLHTESMDRIVNLRFAPPLLLLAAMVSGSAALGSWLPLLGTLPWLAAIAWFGSRDTGASREFPSAAETARDRLWTR
jgi:hypothetical protein